jgi:hypothetical protein
MPCNNCAGNQSPSTKSSSTPRRHRVPHPGRRLGWVPICPRIEHNWRDKCIGRYDFHHHEIVILERSANRVPGSFAAGVETGVPGSFAAGVEKARSRTTPAKPFLQPPFEAFWPKRSERSAARQPPKQQAPGRSRGLGLKTNHVYLPSITTPPGVCWFFFSSFALRVAMVLSRHWSNWAISALCASSSPQSRSALRRYNKLKYDMASS